MALLCLNTAEAVDNVIKYNRVNVTAKASQYRRSSRQCNHDSKEISKAEADESLNTAEAVDNVINNNNKKNNNIMSQYRRSSRQCNHQ